MNKGYKLLKLHGQKKIIGSIILLFSMLFFSIKFDIWYMILFATPSSLIMFLIGLKQIKLSNIEKEKDYD